MESEYDLIESYLLGNLDAQQRKDVENRLLNDVEFAASFRIQKLEHEAMELSLEQDLRAKMGKWEQAGSKTQDAENVLPAHKRSRWFLALTALFFALVAGIGYLSYIDQPTSSPKQPTELPAPAPNTAPAPKTTPAMAENGNAAPAQGTPPETTDPKRKPALLAVAETAYNDSAIRAQLRGGSTDLDNLTQLYLQGKFSVLIDETRNLDPIDPAFLSKTELRAHAFYHLKKYALAAQNFAMLAQSKKEPYAERSEWYLLLAYMAQGKTQSAEQQRQYILNQAEHSFRDQVLKIKTNG